MNKHICGSVIIKCIDFRLVKETIRWLNENNLLGDCDIVSVAGASKAIIDDNEEIKNFLIKQIEISHNLHNSTNVILLHHSDCGSYKRSYNFSTLEEEKQKQTEDMKKVEEIIKAKFPEMTIKKVWAQMLDEHGEKVNFEKID